MLTECPPRHGFSLPDFSRSPARRPPPLDTGWWVVVGSFPSEPAERQQGDLERVGAAAKRCGLNTFNDLSEKFVGFAPGYNVFVIGAFASRRAADAEARAARRCFPDAYVKHGEYLGE